MTIHRRKKQAPMSITGDRYRFILPAILALISFCGAAFAELTVSRCFTDHMVLQRGKPVLIRGAAAPEADVTVTFADQEKAAKADESGVWEVTLDPIPGSLTGRSLTALSGGREISIDDVVVGDVILMGRQTTVDISLGRDEKGVKAVEGLRVNPRVRFLTIRTIPAKEPLADLSPEATGGWQVMGREQAFAASSAAVYLGAELGKQSDVPVGIIDVNMGPYFPIAWMSHDALLETGTVFGMDKTPVEQTVQNMLRRVFEYENGDTQADLDAFYAEAVEKAKSRGLPIPKKPALGPHPLNDPRYPAAGYNAVLHPLRGMALKGILLQLGNDYPYMTYRELFKAGGAPARGVLGKAYKDTYDLRKWCIYMEPYTVPRIPAEWRTAFSDTSLPMGLIMPPGSALNTMGTHNCEMRELQRQTAAKGPNIGLILPGSEHIPFSAQPADEALLAKRCLQWLKGDVYGQKNTPGTGPLFDRLETNYAEATIHFKPGTADGLQATPDALDCFEVAGADGEFVAATASIDGSTVRLKTDKINRIAHVRYNWRDKPDQGLTNASGLPAIPFRTDEHAYPRAIPQPAEVLPEEYRTPAKDWTSADAVIVNGALKNDQDWNTGRCLGPTGIKADLFGPNLIVYYVLKGAPAEGKIERHDLIYEVNGKRLGEDPLRRVAEAIDYAESQAGQGTITFGLRRKGEIMTVPLKLEVLGSYSSTSPYDCPKTDRIVANMEEFLAARGGAMPSHTVFQASDALFLLAAGTPKYQGLVRRMVYNKMAQWDLNKRLDPYDKRQPQVWGPAYEALLAGEYYLATGDRNVLPYLKYMCDQLALLQIKLEPEPKPWPAALLGKEGGWRHNFYGGQGYNPMPCAGVPALLGFKFAKEAGLSIDEDAFERGIGLLYRGGAAVGNVGYGSWPKPVTKVVPIDPQQMAQGLLTTHNGSIAMGAVLFKILGDDKTANTCGFKSVYSFNNTHEGHGGNFWNNCWTGLGAKAYSKKGLQTFVQGNAWYRDLHRMYTHGHFQGNAKIGGGQLIALVAPRERLRITGAPESVFAANPPEVLRPALRAHWRRDYAEAEKRVTALIKTGRLIGSDLTKAVQLQRAASELQASIAFDLDTVERLIKEDKFYEAGLDLPQLSQILPPGNERLAAIETVLSNPASLTRVEQDEKRYKEEQNALKFDRLVPAKETSGEKQWQSLTTVSQYSNSFRDSGGNVPEAAATPWRLKVVESIDQAPTEWIIPGFDDSAWVATTLPISWPLNHTALLRASFEVENPRAVQALRLRKYTFRQQNMMIYINGKLVAKINNANAESVLDIPLNEGALSALKKGRNVIAATFRNNWRWGRYTRKIEVDGDNSVYNNGVSLVLDCRGNDKE